jgi:hypothetical protein
MRIRLHPGVYSAALALAGAGAVELAPNDTWAGWSLVVAAGLLFLWGLKFNDRHWWWFHRKSKKLKGDLPIKIVPAALDEEAERDYRVKRAEAEAEDRIRRERAGRLLVGGIGDCVPDVLDEIETRRKHEAELRRVAELRVAGTPPPPPPPAKFDVPLKAVLERIAFDSEWCVTRDWSSPGEQWQQTMWEKPLGKELLHPLASGHIPAQGIRSTNEGDEHGHSDIPADFWRNAKLEIEADRLLCEPGYDYVMNLGEGVMYHDIYLRSIDVDQKWPPRGAAEIEANPSPFVEWAKERAEAQEVTRLNNWMEAQESIQASERKPAR